MYKPSYPGSYYFDTFTFTTMGNSGHRGPLPTQKYANAPWDPDQFSIENGQQQWTVPATGTYQITAAGAYGVTPGRVVTGQVSLAQDQVLSLLVGQQPTPLTANVVDNVTVGGGGGTFIGSGGKLLMVASGGDGTGGRAASFSPYGAGNGQNGAGYLSNGTVTNTTFQFLKPAAYIDGGYGNYYFGGVVAEEGGFGGGQSPVASGVSGGGGYTGSPGNGTTGATCYADPSVVNFTDLGATGNTAGCVTVSLLNTALPKQTWTWDSTQQWSLTNQIGVLMATPVWSSSLAQFITVGIYGQTFVSPDGVAWSIIKNNLPSVSYYSLILSSNGVFISIGSYNSTAYMSNDAYVWTTSISSVSSGFFLNNLFILCGNDNTTLYTSPDGKTWTTIIPNVFPRSICYGSNMYMCTANQVALYKSTDLTTWTAIQDSNVVSSTNGWNSVAYDSGTFVALRVPFSSPLSFTTTNNNMSPRPVQMVNNPINNITSLTFTGSWQNNRQARVGDTITFTSISGFLYTISPATVGTITAVDSGSVTVSIVSSTITATGSGSYNINLQFTPTNPTNYVIVTSTDGSTWYGRSAPIGYWLKLLSGGGNFIGIDLNGIEMSSQDKGVTWAVSSGIKGATRGVYSPDLKYFLLTDGNIFYSTPDGSVIVPVISGGTRGGPSQLVWADTLGIIVVCTGYSIFTSPDGVNWTIVLNLKPDGSGADVQGIALSWSRELGIIVAYFNNYNTNNAPLLYTSTDGITWALQVLSRPFTQLNSSTNLCNPCWSPQVGLFTNGEATSRDGVQWVFGSGLPVPTATVLYNYVVWGGRVNYSTYGINGVKAVNVTLNNTTFFDNTTQISPYYPQYFAASIYESLVMLGRPGDVLTFTANVFTTPSYYVQAWVGYTPGGTDTPWVTIGTQTGFSTGFRNVTFTYTIPSNKTAGHYALAFSCMSEQLTYPSNQSYTALGNINEYSFQVSVTTSTQFSPALACAAWSPALRLFVGSGSSSSYYSYDGQLWNASGSYIMQSIAWAPSLNLFVGVGETVWNHPPFLIYNSNDGINWTQVYSNSGVTPYQSCIVWAPELSLFLVQFRDGSNATIMLQSINGVTWTPLYPNIISNISLIWSPELKTFTSAGIGGNVSYPGMYNSAPAITTL